MLTAFSFIVSQGGVIGNKKRAAIAARKGPLV